MDIPSSELRLKAQTVRPLALGHQHIIRTQVHHCHSLDNENSGLAILSEPTHSTKCIALPSP